MGDKRNDAVGHFTCKDCDEVSVTATIPELDGLFGHRQHLVDARESGIEPKIRMLSEPANFIWRHAAHDMEVTPET